LKNLANYLCELMRENTIAAWKKSRTGVGLLFLCGCFVLPAMGQTSFWSKSSTPGTPQETDDQNAVTLGLKFYSDVPGTVTAVRFYKGPQNTGSHVGALWLATGTKLAQVTFSGETASGWQQANLSSPVSIAAKTVYVVSYLAPRGNYPDDQYYSWSTLNAKPLHVSGSAPGVYAYGSSIGLPTQTWNDSNYWVDVVFVPAGSPPPPSSAATYSISGKVTGSAATITLSGAASQVTKTNTAGNYSFAGLKNGSYVVAPSETGHTFSPSSSLVSVNGASDSNVNFTAKSAPASVAHSVSLSWNASTSPNISGYKVYRGSVSGGPYTLISASVIDGISYVDNSVVSGQTYYYVATSVGSNDEESGYSNQAVAVVP